jgi:hypothetical protein
VEDIGQMGVGNKEEEVIDGYPDVGAADAGK